MLKFYFLPFFVAFNCTAVLLIHFNGNISYKLILSLELNNQRLNIPKANCNICYKMRDTFIEVNRCFDNQESQICTRVA